MRRLPTALPIARPIAVSSVLALALLTLGGCADDGSQQASDPAPSSPSGTGPSCTYASDGQTPAEDVEPPPATATLTGTVDAEMKTSAGDIGLHLDADATPCTVNSFVSLADQGYFDDTPCHRLTTEATGIFVLQCGDPTGTGTGGPGYTVQDELTGKEKYPAGTLAMARTQAPDSGGSQFFIVYDDTPLPASYAVFGTVDDAGLAVVRKVAEAGVDDAYGAGDGHPSTPVQIESVTVDH